MSKLKNLFPANYQNEKDHRGNGGLIEKDLNQLQDNTNGCTEVKRTFVLNGTKSLLADLNTACKELANAKQELKSSLSNKVCIEEKITVLGFEPVMIEKEIHRLSELIP